MTTLEVDGLGFAHGSGGARRVVLTDLAFSIGTGRTLALTGRSGAGKTTVAEIVLGLRRPAKGTVRVDGSPFADARRGPSRRVRRLVQGVPQNPAAAFVPQVPVGRQILAAVRRLAPEIDPPYALAQSCRIAEFDTELLTRPVERLSGGQAQRAAIARAVAPGPRVIVADEPTSALDVETAHRVGEGIRRLAQEAGVALLIVTHDPRLARLCDGLLNLDASGPDA